MHIHMQPPLRPTYCKDRSCRTPQLLLLLLLHPKQNKKKYIISTLGLLSVSTTVIHTQAVTEGKKAKRVLRGFNLIHLNLIKVRGNKIDCGVHFGSVFPASYPPLILHGIIDHAASRGVHHTRTHTYRQTHHQTPDPEACAIYKNTP